MFTKILTGFMLVMAFMIGSPALATIPDTVCGSEEFPLTAGQTLDVGYVVVANDETNLYVKFILDADKLALLGSEDAYFEDLHVWVGQNLDQLPTGPQGQPIPGQFPYKLSPPTTGVTEYTFVIPLVEIGLDSMVCPMDKIFWVAHAAINMDGTTTGGTETAFGGNNPGNGPRWWFYDDYVPCCDDTPPPVNIGCETAFGYGDYILAREKKFRNGKTNNPDDLGTLDIKTRRWGWANEIMVGADSYDIYAGAGLNNTSRGTLVGTASIAWDGSMATVTVMLDEGYSMEELHVYLDDAEPTTAAPGRYGINEFFDPAATEFSNTYYVEDIDGDGKVWLIVHSVVCSEEE